MNRAEQIEQRLTDALDPTEILVKDQSHLHAGHAGARDGMGHFEVVVVSSGFEGKSRIARHRIVFDALGDMMQTDIHALKIRAYSPEER